MSPAVTFFTPTNDPGWLYDIVRCLQRQTCQDFEWVVLENTAVPWGNELLGERKIAKLLDSMMDSLGAKFQNTVYTCSSFESIGRIKAAACHEARGDFFAELDHDDLISDDCVEKILAAAKGKSDDLFLFSDDISTLDGQTNLYDKRWGWRHKEGTFLFDGKPEQHIINATFPVNAKSLSEILWAPDHIRVWSRKAYQRSGGHNPRLTVGDDHDLICRTYLQGTEFVHIPEILYHHRARSRSASVAGVDDVQRQSFINRDTYLHDLVREWCRREKLPMYDLGGAHNQALGFTPIDKNLPRGMIGFRDDVLEMTMEPNSVGCFRAFDFLEHISPADTVLLMNKLYDALVPGGWLLTHTPAVGDNEGRVGFGSFQDPTHASRWSQNNWWYFTDANYAKYVPEIRCRFQPARIENWYPNEHCRRNRIPYITADLTAIKGDGPFPGEVLI